MLRVVSEGTSLDVYPCEEDGVQMIGITLEDGEDSVTIRLNQREYDRLINRCMDLSLTTFGVCA